MSDTLATLANTLDSLRPAPGVRCFTKIADDRVSIGERVYRVRRDQPRQESAADALKLAKDYFADGQAWDMNRPASAFDDGEGLVWQVGNSRLSALAVGSTGYVLLTAAPLSAVDLLKANQHGTRFSWRELAAWCVRLTETDRKGVMMTLEKSTATLVRKGVQLIASGWSGELPTNNAGLKAAQEALAAGKSQSDALADMALSDQEKADKREADMLASLPLWARDVYHVAKLAGFNVSRDADRVVPPVAPAGVLVSVER